VDDETVTVSGNGSYTTPAGTTPAQAGTYWWTASYSGDANNSPAATNCGDESVVLTATPHLYWADQTGGTVDEANLDGSNPHAIITGNQPYGVAVNNNNLYWTDLAVGTINEANLDGSNSHAIITGQPFPAGVAVNDTSLYWDTDPGELILSNLNGTGGVGIGAGLFGTPHLLVLTSTRLWVAVPGEATGSGEVASANLDGASLAGGVLSNADGAIGVALTSTNLYWTDQASGTVWEATFAINDGDAPPAFNAHVVASSQGARQG
jgi:uncharacterized protein YjbI with pentapeptide repeats